MIKSIKKWFETAKPNPTPEDISVQIGCHYEEVCEMMSAIGDDNDGNLEFYANYYKNKDPDYVNFVADINEHEKQELLDALCDQIVTAVGVAHMLGMDIEGALNEVNNSNWSKFEDGKPVFNEQGKIAKGKGYFAPDLTKFIGGVKR